MVNILKISIVVVLIFTLSACVLEKRLYTKGYYVNWRPNNSKMGQEIEVEPHNKVTTLGFQDEYLINDDNSSKTVVGSEQKFDFVGDCDTLYFRDGSFRLVTVTDTSSNTVVYKNCSLGKSYSSEIPTSKIAYITFKDGTKRIYNSFNASVQKKRRDEEEKLKEEELKKQNPENKDEKKENTNSKKTVDAFGLLSFIFSFVAMFAFYISIASGAYILGILSVVFVVTFAIIGIIRISKNRDTKKGLWMPIVALGIIAYTLFTSALAYFYW